MTGEKKWVPIICVDMDGVLNSYSSGWQGAGNMPDPPVPGAIEWLVNAALSDKAQIAIYSSRSKEPEGIEVMQAWLVRHVSAFFIDQDDPGASPSVQEAHHDQALRFVVDRLQFPTEKPAAIMTIDDRAHRFEGRFRPLEWYLNFKPWYRRSPEEDVPDFAQPGYAKDWNQQDEDLADETLETLLDCLTVDRDGFMIFEPSALEYMASMFMEARKKGMI